MFDNDKTKILVRKLKSNDYFSIKNNTFQLVSS